jgi:hypothetical protein
MVFHTLFKDVQPVMEQKVSLLEIFTSEFVTSIEILKTTYPDGEFVTKTWLLPKYYRTYLQNCGFHLAKCCREPLDNIAILFMLLFGNRSIIKSVRTLHKHKDYKISWSRFEAEHLLSYVQKPEIARTLRISQIRE